MADYSLTVKRMRTGLVLLAALALGVAGTASAQQRVQGSAEVSTEGGYARLVIHLDEDVPATVGTSGAVLIIKFAKPVAVVVERLNAAAPGYISAARADPDGSAIRIALARKIKLNTIPAGERLFVDLLPDNWKGLPPGLPQQTIDELARRVREAERQLREQRSAGKTAATSIRVKVGTQPTFVRYVFELADKIEVVPEQKGDRLTLNFDRPVDFDLGDAKTAMPPSVRAIDAERRQDSAAVIFTFKGAPKVRSFREDHSFVVDVPTASGARSDVIETLKAAAAKPPDPASGKADAPAIEAPQTVPAEPAATPSAAPHVKAATAMPEAAAPSEPPAQQRESPAPSPQREARGDPLAEKTPLLDAKPASNKPEAAMKSRPPPDPGGPVTVDVQAFNDNLRLYFPFATPTPAAVFRRADMLWLLFDSDAKINVAALTGSHNALIKSAVTGRTADGATFVRLRLERPRLISLAAEGPAWILGIGDNANEASRPLAVARSIVGKNRSSITIPFAEPGKIHRIDDPDVGDRLIVVTGLAPARGFLKPQEFVELRTLASTHGVAVQPIADDVGAELAPDKIILGRPGGLSLSSAGIAERDNPARSAGTAAKSSTALFNTQTWGFDREGDFLKRQSDLLSRAASAPEARRRAARLDLARFYLAREMGAEAKGVLDVVTADSRDSDDVTGSVLKAVADLMLDRPDEALRELTPPQIGNQFDAAIWRAVAHAREGKWTKAWEEFKHTEVAAGGLPIELQRMVMREAARASIEVRDFTGASRVLNDFETIGIPPEIASSVALLHGRLNEALGRKQEALASYRAAVASSNARDAARGRLRETVLRFGLGDLKREDMIADLERATTSWRGDEIEAEGLQILAHLYTEDGRYRDAFHVMRTALLAHPNSDLTRKIQDEAAVTFDSLFLAGKGDAMPPVEALGLFYDYRELTPIGRRGDEMIRRLADRLVSVDLLDQAAELLQHQVDHRLQGAARAQVATRLAGIYLVNRKPDQALAAIQRTRSADLAGDLRDRRRLLEARALSDTGRPDMALEVISDMQSHQAVRLRGDILWGAKRWREAAEQIELLLGERWKDFSPLTADERRDVLRAGIGYALSEEALSLTRFREKFAARMSDGPDRRAFDIVTTPIGTTGPEFRDVASSVATVNTLDAFMRDMAQRYPEKELAGGDGDAAKAATMKAGEKKAENVAPSAATKEPPKPGAKADTAPTGSIGRTPAAARASATPAR
jgi:tetratricopeptide (TPR) repeat protein